MRSDVLLFILAMSCVLWIQVYFYYSSVFQEKVVPVAMHLKSDVKPEDDSPQGPESVLHPCGTDDPLCTRYLQPPDAHVFQHCYQKFHVETAKCRFLSETARGGSVALVSFPGSGNTWVRSLLEQVTGICTGSVYCDRGLALSGMAGEGVRSGRVLVVKTHRTFAHPRWANQSEEFSLDTMGSPPWVAAILIVRNPLDAMVAEWNRLSNINNTASSHVLSVGPEHFGENKEWQKFVRTYTSRWKNYFTNWYLSGHPALLLRYEDLKSNTLREVKRMLDFLKFPYHSEAELQERIAAANFTRFQRMHRNDTQFEHFTLEQRNLIRGTVRLVVKLLRARGDGNASQLISDYL